MSLPFLPPPQHLAVDDVLPVEIIGDSDSGFQDARAHFDVEHRVVTHGRETGRHTVITVPIASAIFKVPSDFDGKFNDDFLEAVDGTVVGAWASGPQWKRLPYGAYGFGLEFRTSVPWQSCEVHVRGTSGALALGWHRWRIHDDARGGRVMVPDSGFPILQNLVGVTHILLLVFGDA